MKGNRSLVRLVRYFPVLMSADKDEGLTKERDVSRYTLLENSLMRTGSVPQRPRAESVG